MRIRTDSNYDGGNVTHEAMRMNIVKPDVLIPKIKNGSKISMGKLYTVTFNIDHHFNWFQKKMIKWCFGLTVEDYSEN